MKHLLLALCLLLGFQGFSQKEKKEKKPKADEKYFYKETTVETDDYKIYIIDGVAVGGYAKFKMKVFNKTNDYLLVKPSEIIFSADGKTIAGTDKNFVVPPNEEGGKTLDFKGKEMQSQTFTIEVKGIYKASAAGKVLAAPDFVLPASTNEFKAGGFTCVLKDEKLKTDKSSVKFDCAYNGDGAAILDPYKCAAAMPGGKVIANTKKYNGTLLENGKKEDFFVVFAEVPGAGDLQKGFTIKWNETFKETTIIKVKESKVIVEKDEELTKAKQ